MESASNHYNCGTNDNRAWLSELKLIIHNVLFSVMTFGIYIQHYKSLI